MKLFAIFLQVLISASSELLTISLEKVDPLPITLLKQGKDPKDIENSMQLLPNGSIIPVPLLGMYDREFIGDILLGHPGQKLSVSFDSVWEDTWVPIVSCPPIKPGCWRRKKYDPTKSSHSVATKIWLNESFGNDHLTGRIYSDLMHINSVTINDQKFAAVQDIPSSFLYYSFDGIVGLSMGCAYYMPNIIDSLKSQEKIDRRVFAFYFNRKSVKKGGTLAIGGVETRHFKGNFTYVNVKEQTCPTWMISVDSITVVTPKKPQPKVCVNGCEAIFSTGSTSIFGPQSDIQDINLAIQAKYLYLGYYSVDCKRVSTLPKIQFSIGGKTFTLNGYDYIEKVNILDTVSICLSAFTDNFNSSSDKWYIGAAFMSKYYTSFDMDQMRIGFADALYEENDHISVNVV